MAEVVQSLFGVTPQSYQRAQQQNIDAQALRYAQLDPFQQATYGITRGANMLGGAVAGAFGVQDPELQRITRAQQIASQIDFTDPASIQQGMAALGDDVQSKQQLAQIFRQQQESGALIGQRGAAERASMAQAGKAELSIAQETKLRDELSKLPPTATEADIRGVVVKYGDPDKVLTALTAAATREADRQARTDAAKLAADTRIEAANIAAETRLTAAREAGATKEMLARLAADLKGPSPAVIKAQEKAEKLEQGQEALGDTLATAKTLVKDLAQMGGMTSTSKGPLANLITSAQTGAVGQMVGGALGTKAQAKRDELQSIRLQLFNAVKEASGISASQLNSNVELMTYLNSLGSAGMSKEANEAILDNISRRYLRKTPGGTAGAPGTPGNPIKLGD